MGEGIVVALILGFVLYQHSRELRKALEAVRRQLERHERFIEAYAGVISLLGQTSGSERGFRVEITVDEQLFGRVKFVGLGANPADVQASVTLVNLMDPREILIGFLVRDPSGPGEPPQYRFFAAAPGGPAVPTEPGRLRNGVLSLTGDWRLLSQLVVRLYDGPPPTDVERPPTRTAEPAFSVGLEPTGEEEAP